MFQNFRKRVKSLSNVSGKGDSSSCKYDKAHLKGSLLCNCISYGSARPRGKKILETLDVASTNSKCQREERAPSFVD